MTVQVSGPLPRSLVVAALTKPQPDGRRSRGWMRRRGLRPVSMPMQTASAEAGSATAGGSGTDTLAIDASSDFVQCQHPGCCALRPLESDADCPVCGRR
jgi:hypothetical protein